MICRYNRTRSISRSSAKLEIGAAGCGVLQGGPSRDKRRLAQEDRA
jgi:hypothetical protein